MHFYSLIFMLIYTYILFYTCIHIGMFWFAFASHSISSLIDLPGALVIISATLEEMLE